MKDHMNELFDKVVREADVISNKKARKIDDTLVKAINVYNIPKSWLQAIKTEGQTFSSFAKLAIREKLKSSGLL